MRDRLRDYGAEVEQGFQTFTLGDQWVSLRSGSSEDGDWLRFLLIRSLPLTSTAEERAADPRCPMDRSGGLPKVRHPDGTLRTVKTDGRVYLFVGDELRTMRVDMNDHTDLPASHQVDSLEAMWDYLQRFRVPG